MHNLLELNWNKLPDSGIPATLREWLLYAGSFMERLKQHGIVDARIQVLQQEWQLPEAWERKLLSLDVQVEVLVREVLILSETKLWMFARSLFPRHTLTGKQRQLAHLKTRSLGSVLFNDKEMQRSEFEFTCVEPGMFLHDKMKSYVGNEPIWTRRSLFSIRKKTLLLTEAFTPDIISL